MPVSHHYAAKFSGSEGSRLRERGIVGRSGTGYHPHRHEFHFSHCLTGTWGNPGEKRNQIPGCTRQRGEPKAVDATLSIMVGGEEAVFNECLEILQVMGKSVVRVGAVGSGNITKLANQVIVALNIAALSEALVLGTKAGVDPVLIYNAIRGGLAGSTVMEAKALRVMEGNFEPGFKIDLHIKDLANALEAGRQIGAPLFLTAQVMEMLKCLKLEGKGQKDHSAILNYYEKLAGVEVRKKK